MWERYYTKYDESSACWGWGRAIGRSDVLYCGTVIGRIASASLPRSEREPVSFGSSYNSSYGRTQYSSTTRRTQTQRRIMEKTVTPHGLRGAQ